MSSPTPNPSPAPVVVYKPDWIARLLLLAILGMMVYQTWTKPSPTPVVTPPGPTPTDMASVGHNYVVQGMAATWADAMDKAGTAVEGTATMADVEKSYLSDQQSNFIASFGTIVKPSLQAILPSKSTLDATTRPKVGKAFHDLATGARTVK